MNKMFATTESTTNLCHQIIQRETNCNKFQRNLRDFSGNLFRERFRVAKNLYKTDLKGHFGCVNAIEFSHGGQHLASGGDDKRVLVWDVEKSLAGTSIPRALATEQASNIFCLGFDSKNRKLISGGNDALAISHDFETGKLDNVFKHEEPVYGLSIDPQNDSVFATASENGVILLFDQRTDPADPLVVASVPSSFHAVEFHPTMSNLLVTANSKRGATLYDIRKPKQPVILYGDLCNPRSCMSVRFNRSGKLILGLRRRLPPILYDVNSPEPICTFYHSNYYNSCTMKSCTFAGEDDEMVISGSDDFNLYVWRLSDIDLEGTEQWVETTQMVLYGHRSIVNQVRYNRQKCLLASSGVEKVIKVWSPFSQHNWTGSLTEEASSSENPRELYSPYNLFTMALPENWHHLSHDYSSENTNEDPRMMAFFDSLIQQEIEEWETNSSTEASQEDDRSISPFFSCVSTSSSSTSSSSSDSSSTASSSSSSSSSSDSDNDNENKTARSKSKRRQRSSTKRHVVNTRRKVQQQKVQKRKQRYRIKSKIAQVKNNQQLQKPTNRIAYLIAKKRNTLRRLAIKGASLNNRRSSKLVVVVNGRARNTKKSNHHRRQRSVRRSKRVSNSNAQHSSSNNQLERPTTSAAAAAALAASSSSHHRQHHKVQKKKSQTKNDSNCSSEEDSGNFAISNSSRSNAANTSPSSTNNSNNNNANVPSTSTGITSNFRDAFLRLSRQIFMSDSEDDDDEEEQNQNDLNNRNEQEQQSNKKPNGANKSTKGNSQSTSSAGTESRTIARTLRSNQRPRNSAALNVINANETAATATILPQRNHSATNTLPNNTNNGDEDNDHRSSRTTRRTNANSTTAVAAGHKNSKKRHCSSDQEDNHPVSSRDLRSSNRNRNELFADTSSSSSSSLSNDNSPQSSKKQLRKNAAPTPSPLPSSPLKKRKMCISDYINVRQNLNNNDDDEDNGMEENNNETNNNDIFSLEGNYNHNSTNGQLTPQRPQANVAQSNNYEYSSSSSLNNNNNSYLLFTPDSGVSLNSSTTPSTIDHSDHNHRNHHLNASTSTSSNNSRIVATHLSPLYENSNNNDCDVENDEDDEGVVVLNNNRKTNLNRFQQKVARVRRNYRKQFVDDTESD